MPAAAASQMRPPVMYALNGGSGRFCRCLVGDL